MARTGLEKIGLWERIRLRTGLEEKAAKHIMFNYFYGNPVFQSDTQAAEIAGIVQEEHIKERRKDMQQIDLSKFKRRQVDMKNIAKPRFFFNDWQPKSKRLGGVRIQECQWRSEDYEVFAVLDRGINFSLTVEWNHKSRAWVVSGRPLQGEHTVWFQKDADFETVIKAVEKFLFTSASNYDVSVFNTPSNQPVSKFVDYTVSVWRQQDQQSEAKDI